MIETMKGTLSILTSRTMYRGIRIFYQIVGYLTNAMNQSWRHYFIRVAKKETLHLALIVKMYVKCPCIFLNIHVGAF